MVKNWKTVEEKIATWLNEQGSPWIAKRVSKMSLGMSVEDVAWGNVASIEVKARAHQPPGYMLQWLAQARANCKGKIPLLVLHKDGVHSGKELVVLTLEDLVALLHKVREEERTS